MSNQRRWFWTGCGAIALLLPVQLPAQSAPDRLRLQLLRDSLELTTSVEQVKQLEIATIAQARQRRDDALLHLRLGLIAMRLNSLDSTSHVDDALGEFEWAASLQPDWPWPWFGIGIAEALTRDRGRSFGGGLWFMLGLDRDTRAGQAFSRAIAADPSFVEGLVEFARTALNQRIDAPVDAALDALRGATREIVGWHPDLLLERGRLERRMGNADSAVSMFTRALLLGRHTALASLELARTLPLLPPATDSRSADRQSEAYYAAARSNERDIVAMIRRDLEPIAADSQLRIFDTLRDSARVAWLRSFWGRRDAIDLRSEGDRLAEHYRRWAHAQREFRLPPFRRHYNFGAELYRSGDPELDDRGIIWIRHGAPAVRIEWPRGRSTEIDVEKRHYGNESWRYDRPDGALVLHFIAEKDPQDFRVVETPSMLDVPGDIIAQRAREIPGMERMLRTSEGSAAWSWVSEDVRLRGRRSVAVATRSDSWERQYDARLSGRVQWLAVGTRDGRPLIHLVYAIDADALRAAAGARMHEVPVTVRAVAFDNSGMPLGTLDTVQSVRLPPPGVKLVAMRAELVAEPGTVRVRLGVELSASVGSVYPVDSLVVPDPRADTLAVSALMVGVEGKSLSWVPAPSDTAWIDAGGIYAPTDTVVVYAEAYGLKPNAQTTLRLAITRQRSGVSRLLGRTETEIAITDRLMLGAPTAPIRRALDLRQLAPGVYTLELRLEQGGRAVVRRRALVVR